MLDLWLFAKLPWSTFEKYSISYRCVPRSSLYSLSSNSTLLRYNNIHVFDKYIVLLFRARNLHEFLVMASAQQSNSFFTHSLFIPWSSQTLSLSPSLFLFPQLTSFRFAVQWFIGGSRGRDANANFIHSTRELFFFFSLSLFLAFFFILAWERMANKSKHKRPSDPLSYAYLSPGGHGTREEARVPKTQQERSQRAQEKISRLKRISIFLRLHHTRLYLYVALRESRETASRVESWGKRIWKWKKNFFFFKFDAPSRVLILTLGLFLFFYLFPRCLLPSPSLSRFCRTNVARRIRLLQNLSGRRTSTIFVRWIEHASIPN